jgi:phage host-nuclease inhibitor protein Gam
MATVSKLKSAAKAYACQSRQETQRDIKIIGDVQRQLVRIEADMNDEIAKLNKAAAPRIDALRARLQELQGGVQTWCEANREDICGKGKTANLITGEVNWRQRPPSVSVRKPEEVIATLQGLGMDRFVRVKDEINKEAILAEPAAVAGIKGISINTGIEDFVITPFEVDLVAA